MNRYEAITKPNEVNVTSFGDSETVLCSQPVYADLLLDVATNADGKPTNIRVTSDVMLLFNQERLDRLGQHNVKEFLEALSPKSDALRELRSKVSDDDLVSMCKSKYIQSASELLSWSTYLNNHYEEILSDISSRSEPTVEPPAPAPTAPTEPTVGDPS